VRRRNFLRGGMSLPVAVALAAKPASADDKAAASGTPFDASTVRALARALAQKPYQAPDDKLPDELKNLTYDQYRSIRFNPQRALWADTKLDFHVEFFHRGFLYKDRVDIFVVADGRAQPVQYSPDLFTFGKVAPPHADANLGFAGFRIHAPINRPDYFDEVCAFLGASYFRAVAKGQGYGLSARGLAIKTADPTGEEFPVFKSFWIERPQPGTSSIVVNALLDSPSAAASLRFTIRPGEDTVFDVEMALYPRADVTEAGIAPLTSMYYFDANDRVGVDDYRAAVHDSNGLSMWTGHGDQLWRPVSNPHDLQFSAFSDVNPRGFGLMQRKRDFSEYQDLEAHYEKRPSLWVEPIGDWGEGAIDLVEIPTNGEIHDNIVGFWRPKSKLQAKGEYLLNYRLHWCWDNPNRTELARVVQTRVGAGPGEKTRLVVVDFAGGRLMGADAAKIHADVGADKGKIANVVAQPNPEDNGWRVSFELTPGGEKVVELHAQLLADPDKLSEAWIYRWTP